MTTQPTEQRQWYRLTKKPQWDSDTPVMAYWTKEQFERINMESGHAFLIEPVVVLSATEHAALQQAQARNAELLRMMEDLTPGGSEFHSSPERCIDFAKTALEKRANAIKRLVQERNTAQQEAADDAAEAKHYREMVVRLEGRNAELEAQLVEANGFWI